MESYIANEIFLPEIKVYYRHGVLKTIGDLVGFIMEAGEECGKNNPNLQCENYCFVTYELPECPDKNIELEYLEQVKEFGKESKNIKFKTLPKSKAISVVHKGAYSNLHNAYEYAMNWVKAKGYDISDKIREVYIHGCWDTENESDYITEIQIPIK